MLICNDCGCVFGEDEARIEQDKDYVNNGLGMECVRCDDILHCPNCDSQDVEEAKVCSVCGEYFYPDSMYDVCPNCIENAKDDYKIAMEVGRLEGNDSHYVNGFLLYHFFDELDEMLTKEIKLENEYFPEKISRDANRYLTDKDDLIVEVLINMTKEENK